YLRAAMGESFTAKDFRTWGGTLAAFQRLASTALPEEPSERALKMLQNEVIQSVADALGNTPAVCRKAYIDPCTFAGWRQGSLQRAANGSRGERQWEQATLKFLAQAHRAQQKSPTGRKAKKKST
ncbi:MAG: DNA topoisomerase IB, partial [Pseudoxanthomonas sp.]